MQKALCSTFTLAEEHMEEKLHPLPHSTFRPCDTLQVCQRTSLKAEACVHDYHLLPATWTEGRPVTDWHRDRDEL